MSAAQTIINWGTRYRINGTFFNATGGRVRFSREAVIVTDSESAGGTLRKPGTFETEITIRGNIATDLNPTQAPFLVNVGTVVHTVEIFNAGIGNPPDVFTDVLVDYFEKVPGGGGDLNQPNTFEFHGYTSVATQGG